MKQAGNRSVAILHLRAEHPCLNYCPQLRLALAAAGKGVTYLSDRLLGTAPGMVVIEDTDIAKMERRVGLFHKKHSALSEGARRFLAICERQFANRVGSRQRLWERL